MILRKYVMKNTKKALNESPSEKEGKSAASKADAEPEGDPQ